MSRCVGGRSTQVKLLASAGIVGVAAGVAGLGTFGTFTSSTSASQAVGSGTVAIALGSAGPANRLSVPASGLVPGDTVQRQVQLINTGDQALSGVTLTTTATTSSKLDTDAGNGLQLTVSSCPTAWAESGTSPAYTYTCSGTVTPLVASRPVIGSDLALPGLRALTPGETDNLLVTLSFPAAAGNGLQGQSSTLSFAFTGIQRTATSK